MQLLLHYNACLQYVFMHVIQELQQRQVRGRPPPPFPVRPRQESLPRAVLQEQKQQVAECIKTQATIILTPQRANPTILKE